MITIWNSLLNLPWWVGKKVVCPNCGRTVQLELGDEAHKTTISVDPHFFEIQCAQCGSHAVVKKDQGSP